MKFQYHRVVYQAYFDRPIYALKAPVLMIYKKRNYNIAVFLNQSQLEFKSFFRQPKRN